MGDFVWLQNLTTSNNRVALKDLWYNWIHMVDVVTHYNV